LVIVVMGLLLAQIAGAAFLCAQSPQPPPVAGAAKPPDAAAPAVPAAIASALARATTSLAEVEKAIEQRSAMAGGGGLAPLRAKAEEVLDSATAAADALRPQLAAVKSQIDKLGAAPAKDAPAEPPAVAAERVRLTGLAAAYNGAIKSGELTLERARQAVERITELRRARFTRNLMERRPSPLTPGAWREIASDASGVRAQLAYWAERWWNDARAKQTALGLIAAGALGLFAALRIAFRRVTNRRRRRCEPPLPTFFERAVSAFWVAALRALPVFAAGFVLYIGLDALDLVPNTPWERLLPALLKAVLVFATISALVCAVLAPAAPQWRLVPLADRPARRLAWLLGASAAVYAVDGVLTVLCRAFYVPLTLSVAQSLVTSLAFAVLLIGILLTPFTPQDTGDAADGGDHDDSHDGAPRGTHDGARGVARVAGPVSRHRPRWLKLPLWVVALGIVVAALLGYVALARFFAEQLLLTGVVVLTVWLGHLAIRAYTRESNEQSRAVGDLLERRIGLDQPRREQLARLIEVALTLALAMCALPFLMLQWGFSSADIRDWSKALLFGFEVGQFRFSLVRILAGIVLFIALLFATRVIQRWMHERAAVSRIDPSIANSIETVVGYAGIALAALIAVSYAGFDITSLAIVAGALSVGIGFGLQSIVNNFVSGLILLIERPIKVGDRVVVGDQQGHVRRISVRATEIETFDKASLIVPNSELITGKVVNWSHRDWRGGVSVKIGVGYDADPDQVTAILKKCAEEHPLVLPSPPPGVALEAFGDSALVFSLGFSVPDIDKAYTVQSDLRIAILKALRAAGIDIPFNQLDVGLRDLEAMRGYLDEALGRRPSNGARTRGDIAAAGAPHPALKEGSVADKDG
jgi:small-conductance mechanosensitive channel